MSSKNSSWENEELDWQTFQSQLSNAERVSRPKAASYDDLVSGRCTANDAMQEFRLNGHDAPYDPDDDYWRPANELSSYAPPYRRQQSWPAAERPRMIRPSARYGTNNDMPASANMWTQPANITPDAANFMPRATNVMTAQPGGTVPTLTAPVAIPVRNNRGMNGIQVSPPPSPPSSRGSLTEEQRRVVRSLPQETVLQLIRDLEMYQRQFEECRFCKNNGERGSYYRGHCLKDEWGRVRCPVLRAFVCRRCGARGDNAHTMKYCPLTTTEERMKSEAMMRSMRMASGRRRTPSTGGPDNYVLFGETPHSVLHDQQAYTAHAQRAPLDPKWTALEQKLMLS